MNTQNVSGQELSPEELELLELLLQDDLVEQEVIPRRENPDDLPLSFAQQRLWLIHQLDPGSAAYNMPTAVRLRGRVSTVALDRGLSEILRRHEVLRSTYVMTADGHPEQHLLPLSAFFLPVVDLRGLPEGRRGAEAQTLTREEARRPFDLQRGPLLRSLLVTCGDQDHLVLTILHHIVGDGWSQGLLVRELATFYEAFSQGLPSPLPEPDIQYADFACWQRERHSEAALAEELAYWRERLADVPKELDLPVDRPRSSVRASSGAARSVVLPRWLASGLAALRPERYTLFMNLVAGFQVLLQRYCAQDDIAVGTPVAGRTQVQTEDLIGCFINTLVLRTDLSGDPSFLEALERVREVTLGAFSHQELPFEMLVSELQPERQLSRTPFFQVLFVLQSDPAASPQHSAPRLEVLPTHSGAAKFDLTLEITESEDSLAAALEYKSDLFDRSTALRMLGHLRVLLAGIAADPDQRISSLPLLSTAERHQLLTEWNATGLVVPEELCIHHLVEAQAARTPEALAVVRGAERLTYRELNERANRLAHHLMRLGVGPEARVGIFVERSPSLVVSLLAVLKAGGAYVPLDPSYPGERVAYMVEDAGARVIVVGARVEEQLPEQALAPGVHLVRLSSDRPALERESAADPDSGVVPDNLSYAIYTSGSTGRPKGVAITHRNMVSLLRWALESFDDEESAVVLLATSISFDVSAFELFFPLARGSRLVVAENILELPSLPEAEEITLFCAVPSALAEVLRTERLPASVKTAVLGGEAVPRWLIDKVYGHETVRTVRNGYGPSENTTYATLYPIERRIERVPIGRPVGNGRMYLLDAHLKALPVGVPGELHIGGAGVARGYLDRPGLTAERFLPDPFAEQPGARMYRVGDIARLLPDGQFEFLGRVDHQVKVRGFRIELGEIETALSAHPRVLQAAARVWEEEGHRRLAAYVVADGEPPSAEELRSFLAEKLPAFMLPSTFIPLESLPLSLNGKVDRRSLPAPHLVEERETEMPRLPAEKVLTRIWAEVLRVDPDQIGIHDNFFTLGGDSILSIQVVARALREGVRISQRLLFQHQTVAELAAVADTIGVVQAEQGLVTGPAPLTPIQRWFFAENPPEPHHFNQTVLFETARRLDPGPLEAALGCIERHHDALRLRFSHSQAGWRQTVSPPGARVPLTVVDLAALPTSARLRAVEAAAAQAQTSLDLQHGPLYRVLLIDPGPQEPGRFFWAIHHLAVDGVSWRLLLEDLAALYDGVAQGRSVELPAKTTSFRNWAERLTSHADSPEIEAELSYWLSQPWSDAPQLPLDGTFGREKNTVASASSVSLRLDAEETRSLLQEVSQAYNTQINDVLLTALSRGFYDWTGSPVLLVDLEGHGREEISADVNLSRTMGWFTSLYPILLDLRKAPDPGASLKAVKEALRRVPRSGLGYGLLRWAGRHATALAALPRSQVVFNYLGQFDQALLERSLFRPARESAGSPVSPLAPRRHLLEFNGGIFGGRLGLTCTFSTDVHRHETIQRLVDAVAARLREIIAHCRAPEVWGYTPSDFPFAFLSQDQIDTLVGAQAAMAPLYRRRPIEDIYTLSPVQEGMLFHTLYAPDSGVYLSQTSFRVGGEFNPPSFKRALARVVERHAILRTSFVWKDLDQPVQVVHCEVPLPVWEEDWRGLSEAERQQRLRDYLARDAALGFALDQPPLMRFLIARETEGAFRLVWSKHLLLVDGWSMARIIGELFADHSAFRQGLDLRVESPPHYRNYIAWLSGQDIQQAESFWRRELAGFREPTPLPGDRGLGQESTASQSRTLLDEETTGALQAFARANQLTVNTLVQGAWALLLSRMSGQREVVFGVTIAGRPPELPGAETMVGPFINTLPLRAEVIPEMPLREWLRQLQDRHSEARQFGHVPLVKVQGWSELPRGVPLFESLLVFENYPVDAALRQENGLVIDDVRAREATNYALNLVGVPGRQLALSFSWDRSRFDADMVDRLLGYLVSLLDGMVRRPEGRLESFDPLPCWERHQLLVEWNATGLEVPADLCLHRLVEAQAARTPEALAVVRGSERLTYRELNQQANRLAHYLMRLGVGPEVRVGIFVERSPSLVTALLAVLKAGGAYVPLEHSYPGERIAYMVEDAKVRVIVAGAGVEDKLPEPVRALGVPLVRLGDDRQALAGESAANPDSGVLPENLSYAIYTSGSTGRPKGVAIQHRNAVSMVSWALAEFGDEESAVVVLATSISFDVSVLELFFTLARGSKLVVAENILELPALPEAGEITMINAVPTAMAELLRTERLPASVVTANVGGEAVPRWLVDKIYGHGTVRQVRNAYGPSENTSYTTLHPIDRWSTSTPPLGRPIGNVRMYVLDPLLKPLPIGVPGELYTGGAGVARGYLDRPALTAERFLPDPFAEQPGARMYRVGDLVRLLPDGQFEFLGRLDFQVKVRGFRIELGEIEAALSAAEGISQAAVILREDTPGDWRLVAYVVGDVMAGALRQFLRERLPDYMIPTAFVTLAALPLTPSGKVDRKALPAPGALPVREHVAPRTAVEQVLAGIWRKVLKAERVGLTDNFFDLGGHSLLATQIASRVCRTFRLDLPVSAFFAATTVADLALLVLAHEAQPGVSDKIARALLAVRGRPAGSSGEERQSQGDEL